jgi:hypothetical protein
MDVPRILVVSPGSVAAGAPVVDVYEALERRFGRVGAVVVGDAPDVVAAPPRDEQVLVGEIVFEG